MTKNDIKELPNFVDTSDIIKLTDFLDKYHVNLSTVKEVSQGAKNTEQPHRRIE